MFFCYSERIHYSPTIVFKFFENIELEKFYFSSRSRKSLILLQQNSLSGLLLTFLRIFFSLSLHKVSETITSPPEAGQGHMFASDKVFATRAPSLWDIKILIFWKCIFPPKFLKIISFIYFSIPWTLSSHSHSW